ncbi:MAG: crossover junction endodeoxyribonuclease RuvC [bacterium]
MKDFVILGIDPGFSVTGFAVLSCKNNKTSIIDYGFLKFKSSDHLSIRTGQFYTSFQNKMNEFNINQIALETSFLGKNAQTFLKLGYLRGILYLLADQHKAEIYEFSPRQIKMSVTGYGAASKEQVAQMILRMVPKLNELPKIEKTDVTDAMATAICGLWENQQRFFMKRT